MKIFVSATEFCRRDKSTLSTSRPYEFLCERSESFRPRRGQASDKVARAPACAILNQAKDFFESLQQVVQIPLDLIFYDVLLRQNSFAEIKILTKILQCTRSDLSLRRVAERII